VSIDVRTNTLIIQDIPKKIDEIRELVAKLDVPVKQVMIEARIVTANSSFAKELE
jgi:type IV pilus assembly protein PilQ